MYYTRKRPHLPPLLHFARALGKRLLIPLLLLLFLLPLVCPVLSTAAECMLISACLFAAWRSWWTLACDASPVPDRSLPCLATPDGSVCEAAEEWGPSNLHMPGSAAAAAAAAAAAVGGEQAWVTSGVPSSDPEAQEKQRDGLLCGGLVQR